MNKLFNNIYKYTHPDRYKLPENDQTTKSSYKYLLLVNIQIIIASVEYPESVHKSGALKRNTLIILNKYVYLVVNHHLKDKHNEADGLYRPT